MSESSPDLGPKLTSDPFIYGESIGPIRNPYETVSDTPGVDLDVGSVALLGLAAPPEQYITYRDPQYITHGDRRDITYVDRQARVALDQESLQQRENLLSKLWEVNPDTGRAPIEDAPKSVRLQLGTVRIHNQKYLTPMVDAQRPPSAIPETRPPVDETRAQQYLIDLAEKRKAVANAKAKVKDVKKDWAETYEVPKDGLWKAEAYPEHLKAKDGRIIKPFARPKDSRWPRRFSLGSLLNRTENRTVNLPPAKEELKARQAELETVKTGGEKLLLHDYHARGILLDQGATERQKYKDAWQRGDRAAAKAIKENWLVTDEQIRRAKYLNKWSAHGRLKLPEEWSAAKVAKKAERDTPPDSGTAA
jgi:hypothetical protein